MSNVGTHADDEREGRRARRLSLTSLGLLGRRRGDMLRRTATDESASGAPEPSILSALYGTDPPRAPDVAGGEETDESDDESLAMTSDDDDDDLDAPIEFDEETYQNTMRNALTIEANADPASVTNYEDEDLLDPAADEFQTAPNIVYTRNEGDGDGDVALFDSEGRPQPPPGRGPLRYTGPYFGRNHCTLTMSWGDYEGCKQRSKRPKRYIIASDGSEGAQYAINWAMGTVLRDGDETLIVAVMETDAKLDVANDEPARRAAHQRIRRDMTLHLCRQAFVLLQRTSLGVKVACQALHATNARHMILDLVDFYSPTMVITGSRGIDKIRGVLGSMSHYLVQKCSVPVMVCHNKLQLPRLPRGKADVVNNVRLRHTRLDQAVVEKYSSGHNDSGGEEDDTDGTDGDGRDAGIGASSAQDKSGKARTREEQRVEREARDTERMTRLNRESLVRRSSVPYTSTESAFSPPTAPEGVAAAAAMQELKLSDSAASAAPEPAPAVPLPRQTQDSTPPPQQQHGPGAPAGTASGAHATAAPVLAGTFPAFLGQPK